VAGFVVTALIFLSSLRANIPVAPKETAAAEEEVRVSIDKELFALAGSGLVSILFISYPFIVLPLVATVTEIGFFSVAFKLVNLISTVLVMLAAVYGPLFAVAAKMHDGAQLRSILLRTQLASTMLYLPALCVLLVFPDQILGFFGPGFTSAQPYLQVLLIGQCVNALTGLPGVMLNMSQHGKTELVCNLLGLLTAAVCTAWFYSSLTAYIVAVIYSASLIVKNIASYAAARIYTYRQQSSQDSSYSIAGSAT